MIQEFAKGEMNINEFPHATENALTGPEDQLRPGTWIKGASSYYVLDPDEYEKLGLVRNRLIMVLRPKYSDTRCSLPPLDTTNFPETSRFRQRANEYLWLVCKDHHGVMDVGETCTKPASVWLNRN